MSFLVYKVSKLSNNERILDRISLYVPKGSLAALLGPSGSGKSSLLRVIAGLDKPTYGSIWLNGRDATYVPAQYRKMGFVFQSFALFQHMNVIDNICFGLKLRKLSEEQITARVDYFLDSLRITDIAFQYPSQLSGGQKQRVALARSLAVQPEFLLLDEPFGALDGELRRHLSKWLKHYLKINRITAIMVTHDQKEAVSMADEILVLKHGHLVQQGEARAVYDQPINRFVGNFLGTLIEAPKIPFSLQTVFKNINSFAVDPVWSHTLDNRSVDKYKFFVRPHELHLQSQADLEASLAIVENITYKRYVVQLELFVPAFEWKLTLQLGYNAFQNLNIRSLSQQLYVKPRPKVLQRAYPVENSMSL
uniref:Probable transport protein n=1 Tax=Zygnema circumcarinatum TaxID=35869 RepID=Q32RP0_ZYGCR|nr:probable transport protein [Zygnema circumcarinatum]AAX45808.1 probable transport protein [Zygnema circumcarinatum]